MNIKKNKQNQKIERTLAKLTYLIAEKGAGMASAFSFHQPKVPKKLCK